MKNGKLLFHFDVAGVLANSILAAANMGNNAQPPSENPNKFVLKTLIGPPDFLDRHLICKHSPNIRYDTRNLQWNGLANEF